jgi:zinc protease
MTIARFAKVTPLAFGFAFALAFARPGVVTAGPLPAPASSSPMFAPDTAKLTLPLEKTRLANGLEVILHEDHRTPIVTVNVWYHVGSKDELPNKNGFAHLFEHVMFQGSKHVPEDTYFRYLERAGATDINGTTDTDRTNYFETVPANRLELALWLESDRMGFLLDHADEQTFASQREVVKNERRQNYENAPYGMVGTWIRENMFPASHPYHLLTIGTPKDLDNASLDDVRSFFRTWYVPNNATLVVAGDIDKKKTIDLVEKYFGPIPSKTLPSRRLPADVVLDKETRIEVSAGVELPRVYISWPTPAIFSQPDAELDLLSHVLSAGKTTRLYKRLVYEKQIAQDVRAYQASLQIQSVYEIVATAQPGHTAEELLTEIDDEIAKLKAGAIAPDELARAKTSIVSGAVFGVESNGARANILNTYNQMTGDPGFLSKDLARFDAASADSVRDAAKRWLTAGRIVTVVTPKKGALICGELVRVTQGGSRGK